MDVAIAGLSCAYSMATRGAGVRPVLYEAQDHIGGHTNTVDLTLDTPDGTLTHGVDTSFLVFNHRTYPLLKALFAELKVASPASKMSFSVSLHGEGGGRDAGRGLEWAGGSLSAVFAQHRNLADPRFLGMLADILCFNRLGTRLAEEMDARAAVQPAGAASR